MKTNFKRLFALLLTLCMLASLMVPVAFAEDEAVESTSANVAETYQIRVKDLTNLTAATAVEGTLEYQLMTKASGDTRKWNTSPTASMFTTAYSNGLINWTGLAATTTFTFRDDCMWQLRSKNVGAEGVADWAALKIRVTNPGSYALSMYTDKTTTAVEGIDWSNRAVSWSGTMNAYIIPLSVYNQAVIDGTTTVEATDGTVTTVVPTATEIIPTLMTSKYSVGSATMAADENSITFEKIRMTDGEYVVVYCGKSEFCLEKMTLNGEVYTDKVQVKSYDVTPFDLSIPLDQWEAHPYNTKLVTVTPAAEEGGEPTYDAIYKATKIYNDNYAESGWQLVLGTGYSGRTGFKPYVQSKNALGAFQIKVPESNVMSLSITTDFTALPDYVTALTMSADDGKNVKDLSATAADVTAYVIPLAAVNEAVAAGAKQADAIAALANAANCVGVQAMSTENPTVTFQFRYMEAGEYIIAYKANAGYYTVSELTLDRLAIDETPVKADVNISETYNLALYKEADPNYQKFANFASEVTLADGPITLRDYVANAYANGDLNWKLENYADGFTDDIFILRKSTDQGLRLNTPKDSAGDWFAVRMRVPQGGYYSFSVSSLAGSQATTTFYMFPANAETMTAEEIAAQIVPANAIYRSIDGAAINSDEISLGYLDGEYIIVSQTPYSKSRQIQLGAFNLKSEAPLSAEDVQFYNFNMFDEANPYYSLINDRYTPVVDESGVKTYEAKDPIAAGGFSDFEALTGAVVSRDAEGNITAVSGETDDNGTIYAYHAVLKKDGTGYPSAYNWRPDFARTGGTNTLSGHMKLHDFYRQGAYVNSDGEDAEQVYSYRFNFAKDVTDSVASFMLHVDKAGTYDLSVASNFGYGYAFDIYFVDTVASYSSVTTTADIDAYIANGTGLIADDFVLPYPATTTVDRVTVDAAGDFLVIFANANSNQDLFLESITLTPVVEEKAAGVGGETYATLQDAMDAAEAGDTITVLDAVVTPEQISVPAGVTLNLNGQTVKTLSAFDAVAPGAQVVDSSDGNGALIVFGAAQFDTNNPQLPLYDVDNAAYHLYNVEVNAVTITGKNSASPKYWFEIQFSNKAAAGLINDGSEMQIKVSLTWDGQEVPAEAVADAAFSAAWANKYAAKDSIYVTVSAINVNVANFSLIPQVAANGVVAGSSVMEGIGVEAPAEPEVEETTAPAVDSTEAV